MKFRFHSRSLTSACGKKKKTEKIKDICFGKCLFLKIKIFSIFVTKWGMEFVIIYERVNTLLFYGAPDKTESESRFELLYQNYKHPMQQAAFGILNDRGLAEDAVQEAFIRMGRNMERVVLADEKQAGKFLMVLARNAAIDIYRKRSRQMKKEILVNEMEEMELFTEGLEADLDEDERVQKLLGKIPVKYRDVLFMKYSHCMENGEIAKTLGISEENVRQRITRGKSKVRKILEKMEEKRHGKA